MTWRDDLRGFCRTNWGWLLAGLVFFLVLPLLGIRPPADMCADAAADRYGGMAGRAAMEMRSADAATRTTCATLAGKP